MKSRIHFILVIILLSPSASALAAPARDGSEGSPAAAWSHDWNVFTNPSDAASKSAQSWQVTFGADVAPEPAAASILFAPVEPSESAEQRPVAFTYSEGYQTRRKIHMYASYATLPLFVAQYFVGQKLYDGTGTDSTKSAHGALVAGMAGLFAVNTVTGVWNMWEARKDPNGRTRRTIHGLMMLVADAGFVATGALAPDSEGEGGGSSGNRSLHRNVALTSMGIATASYLMMLFTR
jgi:hypothetical protein